LRFAVFLLATLLITALMEIKRRVEESRTRAQEALRLAQSDLAHVNRVTTMGELTASLAHEVNQPIAAAVTHANTCLRWLTRDQPDLEEARQAASRMAKDASRAAESSAGFECSSRRAQRNGSWSISTRSYERWLA
jgi:C4-dicarboxylate-specific signal transduction histidine kinase